MVTKNEIKYIQSLCHKKHRDIENIFIVEGSKIMEELRKSNYIVEKIYATPNYIQSNAVYDEKIIEISEQEMYKLSQLQTPSNILALVHKPQKIHIEIDHKLNLILDGIQDPGNLGTIVRIADWYGIENIFCTTDTTDIYNFKAIQSSMGSFVRVNIIYDNVEEILLKSNLPVYGSVLNGTNLYEFSNINNGFLIIGNEGKGIRNNLLNCINHKVTIPKKGRAESLNAAVATGIMLSWFLK
jgi:TrmH family RNA methyltransferase